MITSLAICSMAGRKQPREPGETIMRLIGEELAALEFIVVLFFDLLVFDLEFRFAETCD